MSTEPQLDPGEREDRRLAGFVERSSARVAALERLVETPVSPSRIARDRSIDTESAFSALNALRRQGLVELYAPENRRKGPIYGLTEKGERVAFYVEQ